MLRANVMLVPKEEGIQPCHWGIIPSLRINTHHLECMVYQGILPEAQWQRAVSDVHVRSAQ
jgi:hypothetical protein